MSIKIYSLLLFSSHLTCNIHFLLNNINNFFLLLQFKRALLIFPIHTKVLFHLTLNITQHFFVEHLFFVKRMKIEI